MIPADIIEALDELIQERAERGNAQSKHGIHAARAYEIIVLKATLDSAMTTRIRRPNQL